MTFQFAGSAAELQIQAILTQAAGFCFALPRMRASPDATLESFADLLGVDHQRVRLWMFARAAAESRYNWENNAFFELTRALAP